MNRTTDPPARPIAWRATAVLAALGIVTSVAMAAPQTEYQRATTGTRIFSGRGGLAIKILVEAGNLGSGEVEIGEITFPAGSQGGGHRHGSIEIFYVLEGVMDHVVNGESHRLEPGMVGIVRPTDEVSHRVLSEGPVRALVIWAPGGEAERLAPFFEVEPLPAD